VLLPQDEVRYRIKSLMWIKGLVFSAQPAPQVPEPVPATEAPYKSQIPSCKSQVNPKYQFRILEFTISILFVICHLIIGISSPSWRRCGTGNWIRSIPFTIPHVFSPFNLGNITLTFYGRF